MDNLAPLRYAQKDESTFFTVDNVLVRVGYQIEQKKKYFVLPQNPEVTVQVDIDEGRTRFAHSYTIPKDFRIGSELESVEQGLYSLVDDALRSFAQMQEMQETARKVQGLEEELLVPEAVQRVRKKASEKDEKSNSEIVGEGLLQTGKYVLQAGDLLQKYITGKRGESYQALSELKTNVLTALRHVTNVTSINEGGYERYYGAQERTLEQALTTTKVVSRDTDVVDSVRDFLDATYPSGAEAKKVRQKTREYVEALNARIGDRISPVVREMLVEDFAVPYAGMRRQINQNSDYPDDIVDHAISSFIEGGIKGYVALSLVGETVINNIFGTKYDIPGGYIGAAVEFIWPYLRATYARVTSEPFIAIRTKKLEKRIKAKLSAPQQLLEDQEHKKLALRRKQRESQKI